MAYNAKPIICYENRLDDGTPTATDTASGYDVLNLRDLRTYTFHKFLNATGTKYITIDCGSAKSADSLAIVGHNLYTVGATMQLQSSTTGAWAGEQVVRIAEFTRTSDKAFIKTFTSASARYWRLRILNMTAAVQMAVVLLGSQLNFENWPAGQFDPNAEKIMAESNNSKTGNLLGSVISYHEREVSVTFNRITDTWFRNTFLPVWHTHLKLLKPFFWAWDLTNNSGDVYFMVLPDDFNLSAAYNSTRRTLTLQMKGVSED